MASKEQHRTDREEREMRIHILRGTFGCSSGDHAGVDPYPDAEDWHQAARGDGHSYSGIIATVTREPGEDAETFRNRAHAEARRLDEELGCSRCYPHAA